MPNWCNNTFEVVGPKEKIREFERFLDEEGGKDWFDFFLPCPQELKDVGNVSFDHTNEELMEKYGYADWYSWSVDNWGCKWNCDANDWNVSEYDDENESLTFWFDSPWGPPIALYEWIFQNTELKVWGNYIEEGMCFVGKYDNGEDESYEYDPNDLESLDNIPEEVWEEWNLRERIEENIEMNEDWDEEEELNEIAQEFDELSDESKQKVIDQMQDEFDKMSGDDDKSKKWPF